nr:hypothetical protein [Brevundimonas naejangsanensis]
MNFLQVSRSMNDTTPVGSITAMLNDAVPGAATRRVRLDHHGHG